MASDLFFYEGTDGYSEYYKTSEGSISFQRQGTIPPAGWTHVVQGQFVGAGLCQFIFYDSASGTIQIWMVGTSPDGHGHTYLLYEIPNWRPGYNLLVPGSFALESGQVGLPELLCYDATQGVGEFYYIGSDPSVRLAYRYTDWRTSWNIIVSGNFGGDGVSDLLFYGAAGATGEFYSVDNFQINRLTTYTDWRSSWKLIVPGNFGGSDFTDLVFYDSDGTTGEFYSVNQGEIALLQSYTDWRGSWDEIIPGDFGGNGFTDLLFYDQVGGTGEFYAVNNGQISLLKSNTDWRTSWTRILAGTYTGTSASQVVPFVTVAVEPFAPGSEFELLHIFGGSFQDSEPVALKIEIQDGDGAPEVVTDTIAAPSPGNGEFATYYNTLFTNAFRFFNSLDVVPNAWASLGTVETYYPPLVSCPPDITTIVSYAEQAVGTTKGGQAIVGSVSPAVGGVGGVGKI
jgi:hypothetical protein